MTTRTTSSFPPLYYGDGICRSITTNTNTKIDPTLDDDTSSSLMSPSLEDLLWRKAFRSLQGSSSKSGGQGKNKKKQFAKLSNKTKTNVTKFHDYFCTVHGHERWEQLGKALLQPTRTVALLNVFTTTAASTTKRTTIDSANEQEIQHKQWLQQKVDNDNDDNTATRQKRVNRVEWAKPFEAYWVNNGKGRFEPPSPLPSDEKIQTRTISENGHLFNYYCFDPSSLLPVLALLNNIMMPTVSDGITNKDENIPSSKNDNTSSFKKNQQQSKKPISILDMCAAPGGKTLAILQGLHLLSSNTIAKENTHDTETTTHNTSYVVANEFSKNRRLRLLQVMENYIPRTMNNSISLTIQGRDGVSYGSMTSSMGTTAQTLLLDVPDNIVPFSHVLCDVPCSGERHLVQDGMALGSWNLKQKRKNQKRQISLLKASIAACRDSDGSDGDSQDDTSNGGIIVYSTCSIDPYENDNVVEKVLSKRKDTVEIIKMKYPIGEPTKYGWIILPDHPSCEGLGPLYIATLQKRNN